MRALLGPGFQVDPPSGRGQQFEAMTAAYSMMVEHLEPVRAVHRDVHHLQLVRDRRHPAAIGDRHPARARRDARPDPLAVPRESAVTGLIGSLGGRGVRPADRARHRRVDRRSDRATSTASRSAPTRSPPSPALLGAGARRSASPPACRRADSGAPGGARRSGAGAAEGQVPGAVGGREPPARDRSRRSSARSRSSASSLGESRVVFYVGYVLAIARRAAPRPAAVAGAGARASGPLLKWLRPVEGALAADSLIQAPRRTSASVAALMLSLALVVAFAGMARASYNSIIDWMDTALNPDLFVMPSQDIVIRTLRFPPTMAPELRGDSRRRAGADGAQRAHRVPRDAGHDRGHRRREHRRNRAPRIRSPATPTTMYRADRGRARA